MIKTVSIACALLFMSFGLFAQKDTTTLTLGYFAPYGVQMGGKTGLSFNIGKWEKERENKKTRLHKINLSPQIGYFVFPGVQHNFFVNGEEMYLLSAEERTVTPLASIGLGYLMALQRQTGTVNLATGEIRQKARTLHYVVPTVNVGCLISTKRNIGYYVKTFYGRKITSATASAGFFGFELGLTVKLKRKE